MSLKDPHMAMLLQVKSDIDEVANTFWGRGISLKQRIDALHKWRGAINDVNVNECLPYRPEVIEELKQEVSFNEKELHTDYKSNYHLDLGRVLQSISTLMETIALEMDKAKLSVDQAYLNLHDMEHDADAPSKFEYSYEMHPGPHYSQNRQEAHLNHQKEVELWKNSPKGEDWALNYDAYKGAWEKATEYGHLLRLLFDDLSLLKEITNVQLPEPTPTCKIAQKAKQLLYDTLVLYVDESHRTSLYSLIFQELSPPFKINHSLQQNSFAHIFYQLLQKKDIHGTQEVISYWISANFYPATYYTIYDVIRGQKTPAKNKRIQIYP